MPRRLERRYSSSASIRFATIALITVACGIVALPTLPFVGTLPLAAWPWVVASVILHLGYYIGLTEAYRTGDMGQVYPIARGSAPLMTATASTWIVGESVGLLGWIGIVVLVCGVFLLSLRGGRDLAKHRPARGRLRAVHRRHDLRLFDGRRHRRAHRRQRACLSA